MNCKNEELNINCKDVRQYILSQNVIQLPEIQKRFALSYSQVKTVIDELTSTGDIVYTSGVSFMVKTKLNVKGFKSKNSLEEKGVRALWECIKKDYISIAYIQRTCGFNYAEALQSIDWMEKNKYISCFPKRKVIMTKEEFIAKFGEELDRQESLALSKMQARMDEVFNEQNDVEMPNDKESRNNNNEQNMDSEEVRRDREEIEERRRTILKRMQAILDEKDDEEDEKDDEENDDDIECYFDEDYDDDDYIESNDAEYDDGLDPEGDSEDDEKECQKKIDFEEHKRAILERLQAQLAKEDENNEYDYDDCDDRNDKVEYEPDRYFKIKSGLLRSVMSGMRCYENDNQSFIVFDGEPEFAFTVKIKENVFQISDGGNTLYCAADRQTVIDTLKSYAPVFLCGNEISINITDELKLLWAIMQLYSAIAAIKRIKRIKKQ